MKYLSVCSGIEAATVAWHPLGWEAVAYSEIEKFPSQVLLHHYPNTPNWGDMTQFKGWPDATINVLVGGTPCQSFSVAGLRKGLDDPRGNLMLTYLAIARRYRPEWLVWENVPGVLSSANGRDFGSFLGGLAECGYGFAYRVLDAQYFGVAQRRKRVFVVGNFGNWQPAAAVLFEFEGLRRDLAPSREKRQGVAASVASSACVRDYEVAGTLDKGVPERGIGHNGNYDSQVVAVAKQWPTEVAPTLDAHYGNKQGLEDQHINGGGGCLPLVSKCLITKTRMDAETETLIPTTGGHFSYEPIALAENTIGRKPENGGNGDGFTEGGPMYVMQAMAVRRLTPVECERLQGFPDNYTDIKVNGKPTPDGPRYKALGNSMAVPCMAWIGERIQMVDKLCSELNNSKGKHETA